MPLEKARLFQNVVMKLSVLRYMVKAQSKLGHTDLNRDCETFIKEVLNRVYGYALENLNDSELNSAAIDLADKGMKLGVQVTATSASSKIKGTIEKFIKHELSDTYNTLIFVMLVDKKDYRAKFETKGKFMFDPAKHVWDMDDIISKAEKLPLDELRELSEFVDSQLPSVSRALAPKSLLAQAEQLDAKRPANGASFLAAMDFEPGSSNWVDELAGLQELFAVLCALSFKQREFIAFIMTEGEETRFPWRCAMAIQTVEHKLGLTRKETLQYYQAIEQAGLIGLDNDEAAKNFELTFQLSSQNDAFALLKDYLKEKERIKKVIVDCDFTLLD